ncbi:4'-phosphopantetheinyl transferase family protein [Nesterenkonia sandarakina]|uniref:4'-phosphopantetheinyl transferase n=1 Tax=Nesterenkonia sandarakina TaxID=272918 RepID=A0A7Z0J3C2_9MICC|nr:4'-phosphopantetheinyl transferase family protein [Nesterenkonia sandarakina]NYJ16613.1 4'-phosphopantetheinyl transferase [Nesterenkonia sandarakina]
MISVLLTSGAALQAQLPRLTGGRLIRLEEVVTEQDQTAAAAKLDPADQQRVLAARGALRLTAAKHLGAGAQEAAQLEIRRRCEQCGGPHGRPQLDGISLSSSSSSRHVLAGAAAPGRDVGVDIEAIPERLSPEFTQYALHRAERGALQRLAAAAQIPAVIEHWVLKEAVLKAAGVGLNHPPEELLLGTPEVSTRWHGRVGSVELSWAPVLETGDSRVEGIWSTLIPAPPGWVAAVAARSPEDISDLAASWED